MHPSMRSRAASLALALGFLGACAHANDDAIGSGGGSSSPSSSSNGGGGTGGAGATTSTGGGGPTSSGGGGGGTTDATSTSTTSTSTTSGGGPGSVFFSEYVEGSGNNKALEIVNTTNASFQLAGCQIDRYQNGGTTPTLPSITFGTVSLGPGQVYVVCHSSFAMPSLCDQLDASVSHSGDDAVVLSCSGNTMDAFGQVGVQAVWGTAPTISQDATLRRKCSVNVGDTNLTDAFDPAGEWDGFDIDTFGDLGQYGCP
jgi:predicted extracellular nuclease